MNEEPQTVWMEIYERFRRRVRILSGAIVLLAFAVVFDGLANYDRLSEEYQFAVDLILKEQRETTMRDEIKSVFIRKKKAGAKEWEKDPNAIVIDIKDIRQLHRKYVRSLAAQKEKETFKIANRPLGVHAYAIALTYGPFIVLLAMIWPLLSIRKLHRRLSSVAKPEGPVQQKLNSLFFDRVTRRYGEGWRLHIFIGLGIIFILAMGTPLVFGATRGMVQPDLDLAINMEGMVFPLDDDPLLSIILFDKTSPVVATAMIANLLTFIATIILSRIALTTRCRTDEGSSSKN